MTGNDTKRTLRLRLIRGGLDRVSTRGRLRISVAPTHRPPFSPDAVVEEEDTFLVLSAETGLDQAAEHPIRLMTALWEARPKAPGSVLVRPGRRGEPSRFLAVVHDLQAEPSWREEWVREALAGVLSEAELRGLRRLALPLLGCVHGSMTKERFILLLEQLLRGTSLRALERIWIVAEAPELQEVQDLLRAFEP